MLYIPVADTAKLALDWVMGGQAIVNTLYFLKSGGWTAEFLGDLASAAITWAVDNLVPILSSQISLTSVTATDLETQNGAQVTEVVASGGTGGISGSVSPNNVASVVSLRTDRIGRSYRGRNYICGIPGSWWDGPTLISSVAAGYLIDAYDEISVDIESVVDCTHVIVSKYANLAPRASGVTEPVTAYVVDTKLDSQRRRLAGRGI